MTDDTATPDPSPSPSSARRPWLVPGLAGALVLLIVVVIAVATRGGDDEGTDPAADSSTSATTDDATSAPADGTDSAAASDPAGDPASDNGDPVASPIINETVQAAMEADFPALVPSGVPSGWTVQGATYTTEKGGTWRIDLADPSGAAVVLVQTYSSVEALVAAQLGPKATSEGEVDLGENGTGVWAGYAAADQHAIAKKISDTAALVQGPSQDVVVTLAEQLLTAEDSGNGSGDG